MRTVLRAGAAAVAFLQAVLRGAPGRSAPAAPVPSLARRKALEADIRMRMHLLLICVSAEASHGLRCRIQAADLQSLWYLRSELVATLAAVRGEAQARAEVAGLDRRFRRGGAFLGLAG